MLHHLDARGLSCPLPILKTRQALSRLEGGEVLEVLATDPGSVADFEAFCRSTGHTMLEKDLNAGTFRYRIERRI